MVYKRGRYYWVKFKWKGVLIRKSTRAEDTKTARAVEKIIRAKLARQHAKNVRLGRIRGTALEAFGRDLAILTSRRRSASGRSVKKFPKKRAQEGCSRCRDRWRCRLKRETEASS